MAFQVPASKRSIKQNQFEFEHEGETYSIPKMKYVPVGAVADMEKGNMSDVLAAFGEGKAAEVIRGFDSEQLEAFMTAWGEDSGLSQGESSASES